MENGRETGLSTKTPYHFGQESPGPEPITVTVEQIPERIITKLVINKEGRAFVPFNFSYLFSEPYLRRSCQVVVPRGNANGLRIDVPYHFGRAIVLENGEIPIGNFIAGIIKAKGNSLSGGFINDISSISPTSPTKVLNQITPWGLFGSRDGDTEIEIANRLLGLGFRTALPLGYAVLDLEGYRKWLVGKWSKADKDRAKIIEKSFDIVAKNNDLPIILSEITGVGSRWGLRSCDYYSTAAADNIITKARMADMTRAARLLAREASVFPEQFKHHYRGGLNEEDLRDVLDKMSRMQLLNEGEIETFLRLVDSILQNNADALEEFVRRNNASGNYCYPHISDVCSQTKDLDLAFFQQDYEELKKRPKTTVKFQDPATLRADYLSGIRGELRPDFYDEFVRSWLVNIRDLSYERIESIRQAFPQMFP